MPTVSPFRRFFFYTAVFSFCYISGFTHILYNDDNQTSKGEEWAPTQPQIGAELDDEEGPIFIPITKARPAELIPYKDSDPDWKEIASLNGNQERIKKIEKALAHTACKECLEDPDIGRMLGAGRIGLHWMFDLKIPRGPMPLYERDGIEITSDHIAWTTRPVTMHNYIRLNYVLWPKSMAMSWWAATKALVELRTRDLKKILNLDSSSRDSKMQPSTIVPLYWQRYKDRIDEQQPDTSASSRHVLRSNSQKEPSSETAEDVLEQANPSRRKPTGNSVHASIQAPNSTGPSPGTRSFLSTFQENFIRTWSPPVFVSPAGCVVFEGELRIFGAKANCTLAVVAYYNAKTDIVESLYCELRHLQDKDMRALGGP